MEVKVEIKGIDVVTMVAIVSFSYLVSQGHNSYLITLLSTIIGWYFGRKSVKV